MRPTPDGPHAQGATLKSTRDPRVRRVVALHDRAERERSARYLVEGPNALAEVAAAGTLEEVYATPDGAAQIPPACTAPVTLVAPHVLERMADSVTPRGVVAVARRDRANLGSVFRGALVLVLDGVSDPGNVGTIVRTAVAAGAAGIVLTRGSVDPWNPKAVRASAGAVARVPVVVGVDVTDVIA
ncbi:MAG: RNA methyltransferase, partial [Actinobacteria bacterium]|nr:RNA methyltransferase [Actinomycetota bacterium]